jgi:hypothetical protein
MDDQPTCGNGLAENAEVPARIGELIAAMADVLDMHQQALDLTDQNARPEHHAYVTLVMELRSIAAQLAATAGRMAGYRDLPMGRHDLQKMSGPGAVATLDTLVQTERALLSRLTETLREHHSMLDEMP